MSNETGRTERTLQEAVVRLMPPTPTVREGTGNDVEVHGHTAPEARRGHLRMDIQALRAIAVTAVVLYHLWPDRVPGGFTGVDVFFVISGFLITSHLGQEVQRTGRVSLTQFWARRIRRLLPAAFLVLVFCLVVLVVAMPPVTWYLNLDEIRASAGYMVNWLLGFHAVDYLAAENDASLVQHYWSLAVEEQFYLVWPLLIVGALVLSGRNASAEAHMRRIRGVLALVFVGSLCLSVLLTPKSPALAFFATPLRAWQFAAGGLLALSLTETRRRVTPAVGAALSWTGWVILVASAVLIPGTKVQFPGHVALIPVLGAMCCLVGGDPALRWAPRPLIRNRAVQWVGEHSYAVYLWHWPLIIAAPWIIGGALTWPIKVVMAALTVALAFVSKWLVEDPVRTSAWWRAKRRRAYAFAVIGSVVLIASTTAWMHALDATWASKDRSSQAALNAGKPCYAAAALVNKCPDVFHRPSDMDIAFAAKDFDPAMSKCEQPITGSDPVFCYYGVKSNAAHTVAVIGNSHALRLVPALERWGLQHNWRIILAGKTNCMGTVIPGEGLKDCVDWSRKVEQKLFARGDVDVALFGSHVGARVYMAGNDPRAADMVRVTDGAVDTFKAYRAHRIQVMVAGDVPGTRPVNAPACVAASSANVDPCSRPRRVADLSNTLVDIARAHPQLSSYVPIADFMCDETTCHAVVGGVMVYTDSHHLTTTFSRSLAPYLGPQVEKLFMATRSGT